MPSMLAEAVVTPSEPPTYISPRFWAEATWSDTIAANAQKKSFFIFFGFWVEFVFPNVKIIFCREFRKGCRLFFEQACQTKSHCCAERSVRDVREGVLPAERVGRGNVIFSLNCSFLPFCSFGIAYLCSVSFHSNL